MNPEVTHERDDNAADEEKKPDQCTNKASEEDISELKGKLGSKRLGMQPGVTHERDDNAAEEEKIPDQSVNKASEEDISELKGKLRNKRLVTQPGVTHERNNNAAAEEEKKPDQCANKASEEDISELKGKLGSKRLVTQPGVTHERNNNAAAEEEKKPDQCANKASEEDISELKGKLGSKRLVTQPGVTHERDDNAAVKEEKTDEIVDEISINPTSNTTIEISSQKEQPETQQHRIDVECSYLVTADVAVMPEEDDNGNEEVVMEGRYVSGTKKGDFDVEDMKEEAKDNRLRCLVFVAVCVVVFIMIIVIPISLIERKNENDEIEELKSAPSFTPSSVPTSVPSSAPSYAVKQDITSVLLPIFGEEALTSMSTFHYAAQEWLIMDLTNSGSLSSDAPLTDAEAIMIIQRYISSLLYFSLGGENWSSKLNFLSEDDVCDWNDGDKGLFCEEGIVRKIDLRNNQLSQAFPPEFFEVAAHSGVEIMNLRDNIITGTLSTSIGDLKNMQVLDFLGNKIEGTIPPHIGNMSSVVKLQLSDNKFTGKIPTEVGNLINAQEINFSANKLTGNIPSHFGNLEELQKLYLENNMLTGTLPREILNMPNLDFLHIELNEIYDVIDICTIDTIWADCRGETPKITCIPNKCCSVCCDRVRGCKPQGYD